MRNIVYGLVIVIVVIAIIGAIVYAYGSGARSGAAAVPMVDASGTPGTLIATPYRQPLSVAPMGTDARLLP